MAQTIALAIPTFGRARQTVDAYSLVQADDRIGEIVLMDDGSTAASRADLARFVSENPRKVREIYAERNVGCYLNKRNAVEACCHDWVYLLDSDNRAWPQGIDALYKQRWDPDVLYIPTFAYPHFDYRDYSDSLITRENVQPRLYAPRLLTALNTGNFFVNRVSFLEVFDDEFQPWAADSLYFCYCWLRSGKTILPVTNFHYTHAVGGVSNYVQYAEVSKPIFADLEQRLREGR